MNYINIAIEGHIDQGIKNHFPDAMVTKRDMIPGLTTPVISWCIATQPMHNIEVLLSKYKNNLVIKKYICENGTIDVRIIYSGPIPNKQISETEIHFDGSFVFKLILFYKFIAL